MFLIDSISRMVDSGIYQIIWLYCSVDCYLNYLLKFFECHFDSIFSFLLDKFCFCLVSDTNLIESCKREALVNKSILVLYVSLINARDCNLSLVFPIFSACVATIQLSFMISSKPEIHLEYSYGAYLEYGFLLSPLLLLLKMLYLLIL